MPAATLTFAARIVESLVTRVNSAMYDEEFSGMLTAGPLAGVRVIPVMVAVNA